MGNKKALSRRDKKTTAAVEQAEKLLEVVTGKQFGSVRDLDDSTYLNIYRLGAKALLLQSLAKAQLAMASISMEDLDKASGPQKAIIAGILTDKAEKLAQLVDTHGDEQASPISAGDFRELMRDIRSRVTTLKAHGIELTIDKAPGAVDNGFGAEESTGGLVRADQNSSVQDASFEEVNGDE